LKPPLEILVVRTEIRLGLLLVQIAESAYNVRDVDRGDEARARGQAAYFRANRLLAQVADAEREPLVCDLELLQDALSGLPKEERAASVFRDHACPEKDLVVSLGQLPKKSRRSRSGCSGSLTQSCRDEGGGIDPRLGPKHSLFLCRMKSVLWQCGRQMPPAPKPIYVAERSL
jgi:hypothetical protein